MELCSIWIDCGAGSTGRHAEWYLMPNTPNGSARSDDSVESIEDVPVFILAGGLGKRFREQTNLIQKPMIELGGKPILWHILSKYS